MQAHDQSRGIKKYREARKLDRLCWQVAVANPQMPLKEVKAIARNMLKGGHR